MVGQRSVKSLKYLTDPVIVLDKAVPDTTLPPTDKLRDNEFMENTY